MPYVRIKKPVMLFEIIFAVCPAVNTRTNRNGVATMCVSFEISGREELQKLVEKLRNIDSVIDIERTKGG